MSKDFVVNDKRCGAAEEGEIQGFATQTVGLSKKSSRTDFEEFLKLMRKLAEAKK